MRGEERRRDETRMSRHSTLYEAVPHSLTTEQRFLDTMREPIRATASPPFDRITLLDEA